jgi:hypothetical protein
MTPTPPYKVAELTSEAMRLATEWVCAEQQFATSTEPAAVCINRAISARRALESFISESLSASPALAPTDEARLPPLPEWSKQTDLGGLVPSEIRHALRIYARGAVALNGVAQTDEARDAPKWPSTPQEIRNFIGSNFTTREDANPLPAAGVYSTFAGEASADDSYTLSVHDLLSAFAQWVDTSTPSGDQNSVKG